MSTTNKKARFCGRGRAKPTAPAEATKRPGDNTEEASVTSCRATTTTSSNQDSFADTIPEVAQSHLDADDMGQLPGRDFVIDSWPNTYTGKHREQLRRI